jgi:hypothetical protein
VNQFFLFTESPSKHSRENCDCEKLKQKATHLDKAHRYVFFVIAGIRSDFENRTNDSHSNNKDEDKQENYDSASFNPQTDPLEIYPFGVKIFFCAITVNLDIDLEGQLDHHPDLFHSTQNPESGHTLIDKRHPSVEVAHNQDAVDNI